MWRYTLWCNNLQCHWVYFFGHGIIDPSNEMDMDLWTTLLGEVQESWTRSIRGLHQVHDSMSKEVHSLCMLFTLSFFYWVQTAPVTLILNRFWQTRIHFKAENLLFPTMYNLWGSMMIYLWITNLPFIGLFFQNVLVDHIGVYTGTNKTIAQNPMADIHFEILCSNLSLIGPWFLFMTSCFQCEWSNWDLFANQYLFKKNTVLSLTLVNTPLNSHCKKFNS